MKRVFLDTNVMIDIIGQREPFCVPALQILSLADRGILQICVSAMSYATASFILGRYNKEVDILSEFSKFMQITTATPVDSETVDSSLRSEFSDFEDAMQYFSALRENVDYIVTRNKKDFTAAAIPVFEPQEFIDYLLS
ncbi:MAG: PIN domain-containing protein [Prevotella sp.]|nr:PIN domain-containing protein [Prevotella sp.]